jgi:mannan endo-1,4-beta-mannosidase
MYTDASARASRRSFFGRRTVLSAAVLMAALLPAQAASARGERCHGHDFVKQAGPELRLHGKKFKIAGTNNYYLGYKSHAAADDVLETVAAQGFNVVRTWAAFDIGNQDGSNSTHGKADGVVYYQYWDGSAPAYNDGADGLERLDYVIAKAGELGIKLVLPLTNNWSAFGGMDQYVRWRGAQYHDDFYTDPQIKNWYKAWARHLLTRVNTITGVAYKDDPTIMTWELANEPRCKGSGLYPTSAACSTNTITKWADEMSRFIKSIDRKHLVSAGDEGFFCKPGATDWTENCGEGVDTVALAKLPAIDVMSFHLYPDHWGKDVAWGTQWIESHFKAARKIGKPAMLGEFGLQGKDVRNPGYQAWMNQVMESRGAGALFWMLGGMQDDGTLYPDYDGFTVYCPSPVCTTLANYAADQATRKPLAFAPVADDDSAATEHATDVLLHVVGNDIAYNGASVVPGSVDLDVVAPGQQSVVTVPGATLVANADGSVTVMPDVGFSGDVDVEYTVADSLDRVSNAALISVYVAPDPNATLLIHSFEAGAENWGPTSWGPGLAETSTDFASHGVQSIKLTPQYGHWFGAQYGTPLDLSGKTRLKWEIRTTDNGTSQQVALHVGSGWTWCETGSWQWVNGGTTTTVEVDLTALSCGITDLSVINGMYIFLGNGGTAPVYIDNVRAE